jgi:hypothetical protein
MTDKHLSTQFDAELSGISARVLEMGGLVESQVAGHLCAVHFSGETATQVLRGEERVNQMEVEIDRDLSAIIARRQPTARDLRLLIAISKTIANLERVGDEAARIARTVQRLIIRRVQPLRCRWRDLGSRPSLAIAAAAQGAGRLCPAGHRTGAGGAEAGRPDRPGVRRPDAQADHLHDGRPAHHLVQHRPGVRGQGHRARGRPRQEPGRGRSSTSSRAPTCATPRWRRRVVVR